MAWTRQGVIAQAQHKSGVSSISATLTAPASVGDVLIAYCEADNAGSGPATNPGEITGLADTGANDWDVLIEQLIGAGAGAGVNGAIAACVVTTALAVGHTITMNLSHARNPKGLRVVRWTNNGNGYTVAATAAQYGSSATAGVGINPPAGDGLVLALIAREDLASSAYTPDDDFTDESVWGTDASSFTTNVSGISGYKLGTFDGATVQTFGISGMGNATEWIGVAVVLVENAGGGTGASASGAAAAPSPSVTGTATARVRASGGAAAPSPSAAGAARAAVRASGGATAPTPAALGSAAVQVRAQGGVTAPSPIVQGTATGAVVSAATGAITAPTPTATGAAAVRVLAVGAVVSPAPAASGAAAALVRASAALVAPSPIAAGLVGPRVHAVGAALAPSPLAAGIARARVAGVGAVIGPVPIVAGTASVSGGGWQPIPLPARNKLRAELRGHHWTSPARTTRHAASARATETEA